MRDIVAVQLDKRRPALVLTRASKLAVLRWITVVPITSRIRGIASEVPVGTRNGLDHYSVANCDNITTVHRDSVVRSIGLFFDDQEPDLARAIGDAFDLRLP